MTEKAKKAFSGIGLGEIVSYINSREDKISIYLFEDTILLNEKLEIPWEMRIHRFQHTVQTKYTYLGIETRSKAIILFNLSDGWHTSTTSTFIWITYGEMVELINYNL